jgi:TPR repeat protein
MLAVCQKACDADPADCAGLGDAHLRGYCGLARDATRAIALYEKACGAGHQVSCLSAAQALADRGTPDDVARGIRLYGPRCHEIGDSRCEVLAQLLRRPSPLRDAPRALALYAKACGTGGYEDSPESCEAAAEMIEKGEVPADAKRAERLRRLAARIQKLRQSEGR